MEIRGDLLTDKENAGAALLDACKEVKTSDPVQIGSYPKVKRLCNDMTELLEKKLARYLNEH